MSTSPLVPVDLFAFTSEILNGRLKFLCSVIAYEELLFDEIFYMDWLS